MRRDKEMTEIFADARAIYVSPFHYDTLLSFIGARKRRAAIERWLGITPRPSHTADVDTAPDSDTSGFTHFRASRTRRRRKAPGLMR